jgi:hypothetical protein
VGWFEGGGEMGCGRFMSGIIDTVICLLGVMVVCSCVDYEDKYLHNNG